MTKAHFNRFAKNTRGASLTEYGFLIALIIVTSIGTIASLGRYISDHFTFIEETIVFAADGAVETPTTP